MRDPNADRMEIIAHLRSFFDAMEEWEKGCRNRSAKIGCGDISPEDAKVEAIKSLQETFRNFCTSHENPKRARGGYHYGKIPTYGADLEEILDVTVSGNRAKVTTRQTTPARLTLRYHLKHMPSGWRIEDNRKVLSDDGSEDDWDL